MSTGDPSPFFTDLGGQTFFTNDAGVLVPFEIQVTQVTAAPRTIKSNWSIGAVNDLRDMYGLGGPQYPDNALDILKDALDDPNYDPNGPDYKGLPRWPDGRVATHEEYLRYHPEERLVESMAKEMADEIDREILESLKNIGP